MAAAAAGVDVGVAALCIISIWVLVISYYYMGIWVYGYTLFNVVLLFKSAINVITASPPVMSTPKKITPTVI